MVKVQPTNPFQKETRCFQTEKSPSGSKAKSSISTRMLNQQGSPDFMPTAGLKMTNLTARKSTRQTLSISTGKSTGISSSTKEYYPPTSTRRNATGQNGSLSWQLQQFHSFTFIQSRTLSKRFGF